MSSEAGATGEAAKGGLAVEREWAGQGAFSAQRWVTGRCSCWACSVVQSTLLYTAAMVMMATYVCVCVWNSSACVQVGLLWYLLVHARRPPAIAMPCQVGKCFVYTMVDLVGSGCDDGYPLVSTRFLKIEPSTNGNAVYAVYRIPYTA